MKRSGNPGRARGGGKRRSNDGASQQGQPGTSSSTQLVALSVKFDGDRAGTADQKVELVRQAAAGVQKLELVQVSLDALSSIAELEMPNLVQLDVLVEKQRANPAEGAPATETVAAAEAGPGTDEATQAAAAPSLAWWPDRGTAGSTLLRLSFKVDDRQLSIYSTSSLESAGPITSLLTAHRHTLREVTLENIGKRHDDEVREALSMCEVLEAAEVPCNYVSHIPLELPAHVDMSKVPPVGPPLPASLRRLTLHMQCSRMFCLERIPSGVEDLLVQSFAIDGSPVLPELVKLRGRLSRLCTLELQVGWGSKRESVQARKKLAAQMPGVKVTVRWMLEQCGVS